MIRRIGWCRGQCVKQIAHVFAVLLAFTVVNSDKAKAQSSFVTPFPDGGTYRVFVFGDALGNGLHEGLRHGLRLEPDIRVDNHSVGNSRLSRKRPIDWPEHLSQIAQKSSFEIAVMTFGVSDRGSMSVNGRRYAVGTPEWDTAYGKRIDAVVRAAKAKGAAVYWVGLPAMRGPRASAESQIMNALARERVYRLGGKFVDTWEGFTDGNGNFSPYGPDLTGKIRRLRSKDGVYFTGRGYRKLAHFVERIIRRDVALARAERDVPLAGSTAEQAQIRRLSSVRGAKGPRVRQDALQREASTRKQPRATQGGDHKAAHATVRVQIPDAESGDKKTVQIRILRPALPAVVVGHIQRRSQATGGDQLGRNLLQFTPDGTGILNSVAAGSSNSGSDLSKRISVTQTPYYKALIKGETLPPKPGRTDDLSWPPQNRRPLPGTGS